MTSQLGTKKKAEKGKDIQKISNIGGIWRIWISTYIYIET